MTTWTSSWRRSSSECEARVIGCNVQYCCTVCSQVRVLICFFLYFFWCGFIIPLQSCIGSRPMTYDLVGLDFWWWVTVRRTATWYFFSLSQKSLLTPLWYLDYILIIVYIDYSSIYILTSHIYILIIVFQFLNWCLSRAIPQIRVKKSVTEILLRRFCDRNSHTL